MNALPLLAALACSAAALCAQQTLVVDWMGGPGSQFTDIAPAVAAANHGDVVLVRPGFYSSFVTDKGIAVIGEDRGTPPFPSAVIASLFAPVRIVNLPASRTFRMAGFRTLDSEFQLDVMNCLGAVVLENLHSPGHGFMPSNQPSFRFVDSAMVTLHGCELFGWPAVQVVRSKAVLSGCRLGLTSIGQGGGYCLTTDQATVAVTEPIFDGRLGVGPAVRAVNSDLAIAGTAAALIQGGFNVTNALPAAAAIDAQGGQLRLDPAVQLNPLRAAPQAITGTAAVVIGPVPATLLGSAARGGTLNLSFLAPAGSALIGALGVPAVPQTVPPLGDLWLDPAAFAVLTVATVGPGGVHTIGIAVPALLPRGLAFAGQGLHVLTATVELGGASAVVVH